jgi:hypothetical protein
MQQVIAPMIRRWYRGRPSSPADLEQLVAAE